MAKDKEDIIEIKPGIYGVHLNLRALWRKFFSNQKPDPAVTVAERFLKIFRDHGVSDTQIPRLIPEITLEKIRDAETLLPALTNQVLDKTARLFGIQRAWLDDTTDRIYDCEWSYKKPQNFFDTLDKIDLNGVLFPVVVFCSSDKLDYRKDRKQPLVICLVEKVAEFGEQEVHRFTIFDDGWDWGYWKCRVQLKAMVRIMEKVFKIPTVPMYKVSQDILERIEGGYSVPEKYLRGTKLHNIALDDFALNPEESAVSKEADELPDVFKYIHASGLDLIKPTTSQ